MLGVAEYIPLHAAVPVVIAALRTYLPGTVKIASKYPPADPDFLVRVSRAGGSKSNLVTDSPTMLFECWARSEADAETLSGQVASALEAAQFESFMGAQLRGWSEAGRAPLDDPDKPGMSRWQITGTLGISVQK